MSNKLDNLMYICLSPDSFYASMYPSSRPVLPLLFYVSPAYGPRGMYKILSRIPLFLFSEHPTPLRAQQMWYWIIFVSIVLLDSFQRFI